MDIFSWRRRQPAQNKVYMSTPDNSIGYQTAFLQGIGSREKQEDTFSFVNDHDVLRINQEGLLAIAADGMGGMADGKTASTAAVSSLLQSFAAFDRSAELSSQIYNAFCIASEKVYHILGGSGGSTAILCLFYRERLWFASVGDSGLYLLRNQQLNRLNRRHTVCTDVMFKTLKVGSLDPSGGKNDPEAHALSSFLGMEELSNVDYLIHPLCLEAGDVFLICSDGVDGTLDEETISACLMQSTPEYSCYALECEIKKCAKPYQDNYTGLVIRCVN